MAKKIKLEIDLSHGLAYMRLSSGRVARTIELSDTMLLDLDAAGVTVGLELLDFDEKIPLDMLREYHVPSEVAAEFARLQPTLRDYRVNYSLGADTTVTVPRDARDLVTA